MIKGVFSNIEISGVAAAVADNYVDIEMLDENNLDEIKKIKKTTGVEGKYVIGENQTASDLCYAAAMKIIEEKKINREEIGVLVFVTQDPDYHTPSTACVLQHRLGLSEDCMAFDVNLGCSGFVYGVQIAGSLLNSTNAGKALLLAGDSPTKELSSDNISNESNTHKYLFGDVGTATFIEKIKGGAGGGTIVTAYRTDGSGYSRIIRPYGLYRHPDKPMVKVISDIDVFNFSISKVPKLIKEFCTEEGETALDYDCLVLHQANLMIMKHITKKSGFEAQQMLKSLDKFGNTSSASIPVTLVKEYGEKEDASRIKALMCGFGIGLSWGVVSAEIDVNNIFSLVYTDEYFEDDF